AADGRGSRIVWNPQLLGGGLALLLDRGLEPRHLRLQPDPLLPQQRALARRRGEAALQAAEVRPLSPQPLLQDATALAGDQPDQHGAQEERQDGDQDRHQSPLPRRSAYLGALKEITTR